MDAGKTGEYLAMLRRARGMTQQEAAEQLNLSNKTISKWELNEMLPDIRQSKRLAMLYRVTLDALIDFDIEAQELAEMTLAVPDEVAEKVDWTAVWAQKYPILAHYPEEVETAPYLEALSGLLAQLAQDHGYSNEDAMLVLKDILGKLYQEK